MKLFKQVMKNHYLDLIEFYGVILIMVVPFMIWFLPQWRIEARLLYFCVLQFSIFMGLITRFTRDITIFNTNIQYCLAPIKQRDKLIAPFLFYLLNFFIADLLVLFFADFTHLIDLSALTIGFIQAFVLGIYVLVILTLSLLLSLTLFTKSHIKLPALVHSKINAQQIYSYTRGLLNAALCLATIFIAQAAGKILVTPLFTFSLNVGNYIPDSTLRISINILPYLLLGLVYISLVFILSDRITYIE